MTTRCWCVPLSYGLLVLEDGSETKRGTKTCCTSRYVSDVSHQTSAIYRYIRIKSKSSPSWLVHSLLTSCTIQLFFTAIPHHTIFTARLIYQSLECSMTLFVMIRLKITIIIRCPAARVIQDRTEDIFRVIHIHKELIVTILALLSFGLRSPCAFLPSFPLLLLFVKRYNNCVVFAFVARTVTSCIKCFFTATRPNESVFIYRIVNLFQRVTQYILIVLVSR